MVLTFMGFSGCGKTHLTYQFVRELGWKAFHCDELIETMLFGEIPHSQPVATRRLASWLGQPYSPKFEERQEKYLYAEATVVGQVTAALDRAAPEENIVIDTTGSFIYVVEDKIADLRHRSKIVYFEIPESDQELLLEQYFDDPKPVIWQDMYQPHEDEDPVQALKRCFPMLLNRRREFYRRYADHTLPVAFADRSGLTPLRVLESLQFR